MAIVQISQITNRKGLAVDLPQLAGAEFGWSTDTRQLWIGNGTLEDGAPVIGNTEILTEFSDILAFTNTYTYKGQAAGYTVQTGPSPGTPITQSLQSWLDQFATVKDFGAVGDGVTDDTAAINRALYQLFCREVNPQIRRSLFFPAGVYRVTGSINIPPYATLWGEGSDNSVIVLDAGISGYVARTADSLQQTGVNIGDSGATPPEYITIANMGFSSAGDTSNIFLVQDATNCTFTDVGFRGASTTANLTDTSNGSIGVSFASTPSLVCKQINFNNCVFSGLVYGMYSATYNPSSGILVSQAIQGLTVSNSQFDTLYQGILLDNTASDPTGPGATGFRITSNLFNNIYAEGIIFGNVDLNASGNNIFYDVGNHFEGDGNPYTAIIDIQSNNNISISDMFQRSDADAADIARINLNHTVSIATTNGSQLAMGTYTRESGIRATLFNTQSDTLFTFSTTQTKAIMINYTITRGANYRTGTIMVATNSGSPDLNWSDDFVENENTNVILSFDQTGTDVSFNYNAVATGLNGTINYSVTYLA
jgi:Pectate lyase superfamily protein